MQSDEELTDILLRDIHLPEEDESDIDEIMKIMEVVVKRKEEQSPSELVDVDAAWKSFQQKRMQYAENAGSLQEEKTEEENKITNPDFPGKQHPD